ncbi:UPF0109 protein [Edaphobacter acidisoli]|uniref:RNA-binding protein KhpA n=1 Tax=Edaphobacter acidisoli TaxID=2040573 RepID=A0A916S3Z0_9BACT|nr:KH domain-containing protein [Edaphobacter acidisoli]GGA80066.1 UPF0109 protein [Edaphobacter acidisoli]
MTGPEHIQSLVARIAQSLVDDSQAVIVEAVKHDHGTLLRITVAPGDIGKLIGRQGRTANSLRIILGGMSNKMKHTFLLDIGS